LLDIDFWYHPLDASTDQHQEYWRILDTTEQQRAIKFSNSLLRERYIVAHGRLRRILASYVNDSAENLVFQKNAHGKPYLSAYSDLAFNLSHSENSMVLAVAKNCQLGIDIEHCKPRSSMAALVDKCFAVEEASYWQQLPETEQLRAFYQFWTRKEAFVKATGLGITLGLKNCALNPDNPQQFLSVPNGCGLASDWCCQDIVLESGVCAAVVADKPIASIVHRHSVV
jgi:4'-phosphopantetheinyl transferase